MKQVVLPMFRERVPERLRLPLLLVLPFVYQCSNPLYMNIASSVVCAFLS